ncbi:DMT family transporter [Lachnospiraceae bacterium C1.1]|nr:DMT family transporter [Lachnospiraceae bacterium C1.1]
MKRSLKGFVALLVTTLIWGSAFVAQTSASDTVGAFAFNAGRALFATVFLSLFIFIRSKFSYGYKAPKQQDSVTGGIVCGLSLYIATNLQQFGIGLYPEGVAASGRSGFLTTVYVVIVAVSVLFIKKTLSFLTVISAFICLGGMYLLSLANGIENIYSADIPLLLCAVAFAIYIMMIDHFVQADPIVMSCVQFAIVFVLSAISALVFENNTWDSISGALFPIAYAGIFSSGIAYTLQIVGQKYIEPAAASIIMSLEAVFAAFFGWMILGERLNLRELAGCALVFTAIILSQLPAAVKKLKHKTGI